MMPDIVCEINFGFPAFGSLIAPHGECPLQKPPAIISFDDVPNLLCPYIIVARST
jgi:hypothetical protein